MSDSRTNQSFVPGFTRRHWMQAAVAQAVGWSCLSGWQPEAKAADYAPLNRYPRMVHEWYIDQVRLAERRKLKRLEQLKTKADAEAYVKSVQDRIRQSFGPEPKRTP
ncbi:MAG: hypothetical protein KDA84_11235, partial [Planctomycetaceae bacterium]|nr:hypothetical protein [Planctomycetaceae bacterium]